MHDTSFLGTFFDVQENVSVKWRPPFISYVTATKLVYAIIWLASRCEKRVQALECGLGNMARESKWEYRLFREQLGGLALARQSGLNAQSSTQDLATFSLNLRPFSVLLVLLRLPLGFQLPLHVVSSGGTALSTLSTRQVLITFFISVRLFIRWWMLMTVFNHDK